MIDVKILTEISQEVFSKHLLVLVNSSKALAGIIFLVAMSKKFMTSFAKKGSVGIGDSEDSLSPHDLLRSVLLLLLIGFIPDILNLIDLMLNGLIDVFVSDFKADEMSAIDIGSPPVTIMEDDDTIMGSILKTMLSLKNTLSPGVLINRFVGGVAYYLDVLVFMIYLGKRFFILGVLKVISPLILAFSIFPKYKDLTYNLMKIYVRTFLTIIPMLLVVVFANQFYSIFMKYMSDGTYGSFTMLVEGSTVQGMAILGMVWLKFTLFKQSSEIMKSIWP